MAAPGARAWCLWLLALHGAVVCGRARAACDAGCPAAPAVVCGSDGRSYANACVAACAGASVRAQGYCPGDAVRFVPPGDEGSSSSSSGGGGSAGARPGAPQPNWRAARERAAVVTPEVMNRFADQGYVYRGRVAVSGSGVRPKERLQVTTDADAAAGSPPSNSSNGSGTSGGGSTTTSGSGSGGGSSSSSTSTTSTSAATNATSAARPAAPAPAAAAAVVAAVPAQAPAAVVVAVLRVDSKGNLYQKTFTYDPKRFPATSYPPFDPTVGGTVNTSLAAFTAAAAAASAAAAAPASSSSAAAKAPAAPAPASAPAPTPKPAAAPAPAQAPAPKPSPSPAPAPAPAKAASPPPATKPPSSSGSSSSSSSSSGSSSGSSSSGSGSSSSSSGSSSGSSGSSDGSKPASGMLQGAGGELITPEAGAYAGSSGGAVAGAPAPAVVSERPGGGGDEPATTTVTFATDDGADTELLLGGAAGAGEAAGGEPAGEPGVQLESGGGCPRGTAPVCTDVVTGGSRYFGAKTNASAASDLTPIVGLGRVSGVTLYFNATSGCLRGAALAYHAAALPGVYLTSALLGSAASTPAGVVVRSLALAPGEAVVRGLVYAPTCVKYIKLTTDRNASVSVGAAPPGAALFTPAAGRPGGRLVALRGFQDKPTTKVVAGGAPVSAPGVLKQLQLVWGETACTCNVTQPQLPAAVATAAVPAAVATAAAPAPAAAAAAKPAAPAASPAAKPSPSPLPASIGGGGAAKPAAASGAPASGSGRRLAGAADTDGGADAAPPHRRRLRQLLSRLGLGDAARHGGGDAGAGHLGGAARRVLSVLFPDTRQPCPVLTFPFQTLGQINAKAADGGFVCSGGLIGESRVLTAGHCVWDDRDAQGPFRDLSFSPGQWKRDGRVTPPLGSVEWDYVTLFEAYVNDPDGGGLAYDVAVITLASPVGRALGHLGVRGDAGACRPSPLTLTLAGYPGEDPAFPLAGGAAGGCFHDSCTVSFSCGVSITNHTCDSYVGQSGAPMYDRGAYVRAVHTLGVLPGFSVSNGAITITKFLLDNLMGYFVDGGFAPAPPPGAAGGGYY
ncbi:hypothetical protein HT031_002893 [Scenedesmus sp. PABB004]|nr:hypothetical protein HT031_002893 [Scenedesmus sp. PABB004]